MKNIVPSNRNVLNNLKITDYTILFFYNYNQPIKFAIFFHLVAKKNKEARILESPSKRKGRWGSVDRI